MKNLIIGFFVVSLMVGFSACRMTAEPSEPIETALIGGNAVWFNHLPGSDEPGFVAEDGHIYAVDFDGNCPDHNCDIRVFYNPQGTVDRTDDIPVEWEYAD